MRCASHLLQDMEPVLQCQQCKCRLALQDDTLRASSGSGSRLDESWLLEEGGPARSQQGAGSGSGSNGVAAGGSDLGAAGTPTSLLAQQCRQQEPVAHTVTKQHGNRSSPPCPHRPCPQLQPRLAAWTSRLWCCLVGAALLGPSQRCWMALPRCWWALRPAVCSASHLTPSCGRWRVCMVRQGLLGCAPGPV